MSDFEKEIVKCEYYLGEIYKYIQRLQREGIPESDPVFKVLTQRSWELIRKWEILVYGVNKVETEQITSDASPGQWFELN